jgi:hypothetical protein
MSDMNDADRMRLDGIEEKIVLLEERITTLTIKFDKVYYAITGNELDGNRGIVYRLEKAENKVNDIEQDFNRIKWTVVGWGIGAGLVGGGVMNTVISKLLAP